MTDLEIERCRLKLIKLKAELEALEASSTGTADPLDLDQLGGDRTSVREAMQAHLAAQEATRRRQRQLQKIGGALRRIEAGEYGQCFVCGEDLESGRLDQDPTITRCLNCLEE